VFVALLCVLASFAVACAQGDIAVTTTPSTPEPPRALGFAATATPTPSPIPTTTPPPLLPTSLGVSLPQTNVVRYEPPSDVTLAATGSCSTQSLEVRRSDAWRCALDGQGDYDPCFGGYDASSLVCVRNPFGEFEPVLLNLATPLTISICTPLGKPARTCTVVASEPPDAPTQVWAFETFDGELCILKGRGTSAVLNGERLNYFCHDDSDSATSGFIGTPMPGTVWTARRIQDARVIKPEDWKTPVPETVVPLRTVWW
jgi:hypothetical protein